MAEAIAVRNLKTRRELRAFVGLPWRVYRADPNWVPPLVSDRLQYLVHARDDRTNGEVAFIGAFRGRELAGTVAVFVDQRRINHLGRAEGGFGFFEVVEDFDVARSLLDSGARWLREHGMSSFRGPTNFGETEAPGVLVEGADCPPAMLEAQTPPYYPEFLERFGMRREQDLFAWRADFGKLGADLRGIPPEIERVAEIARKSPVAIRKIRLRDWDREVSIIHHLFNETLSHLPDSVPLTDPEFRRLAEQMRPFLDPDLALVAEMEGKSIGFAVLIPDINRVLIHLNGHLFPFNWLTVKRWTREIDVVSFKLMGVLKEYRLRGIDALLYLEGVRAAKRKGYRWLDGSLTTELNPMINLVAKRLGAEMYKHYRLYRMEL